MLPNGDAVDPTQVTCVKVIDQYKARDSRFLCEPAVAVTGVGFYSLVEFTDDESAKRCRDDIIARVNAACEPQQPVVSATGPASGIQASATISGGKVAGITVESAGKSYATPPVVTITPDATANLKITPDGPFPGLVLSVSESQASAEHDAAVWAREVRGYAAAREAADSSAPATEPEPRPVKFREWF